MVLSGFLKQIPVVVPSRALFSGREGREAIATALRAGRKNKPSIQGLKSLDRFLGYVSNAGVYWDSQTLR